MGIEPAQESFEAAKCDVAAAPNLAEESRIVHGALTDLGARHPGQMVEALGAAEQKLPQLLFGREFEMLAGEFEIHALHRSRPGAIKEQPNRLSRNRFSFVHRRLSTSTYVRIGPTVTVGSMRSRFRTAPNRMVFL
jgi:hypothetical protein